MGHEWSKVQRYHESVDMAKEARNLRRKVDAAKAAVDDAAREVVTDEALYGLQNFEEKDDARHKRSDLSAKDLRFSEALAHAKMAEKVFRPALVKLVQEATDRPAHHSVRFEGKEVAADPSFQLRR